MECSLPSINRNEDVGKTKILYLQLHTVNIYIATT